MKKNVLKYISIAILIASLLTYCKDDSGDALPEVKTSDTLTEGLTAIIGDTLWAPDYYEANISNGYINFTASSDTGSYIAFSIAATVPGVYTFGSNCLNTAIYKPDIFGTANYASYGITSNPESSKAGGVVYISAISSDSSIISGSFIFTMYNSKTNSYITISQGTFKNVPYSISGQMNLGVNAIMNERSWTSKDSVNAKYVDGNNLVMQIATSNNEILEITLQKLAKTTFNINQTSPNSAIYFSQNPKAVFSSNGSINSTGIVEITGIDTSNMLVSGKFTLSVHNPLTKEERTFRAGSFKNIKLEYVASNYLQKSALNANIDGVSWTSPYVYAYENQNNKVQVIATDGLGKPRMRLSVPKDTVNGVNQLEAFYYDNSGKIYISQESQIANIEQDTTFRIIRGSFNFKSINSTDGATVNVKTGYFEVYY